ncbi:MAG: hypothetical protein ABIU05_13390, partial [Nitrospirales bacterium]
RSWLDLLAVEFPIPIVNHNGAANRHLGRVGHGWVSLHGTRPDTRGIERGPFTAGNRPLGAATAYQRQKHESTRPHGPQPIRHDGAMHRAKKTVRTIRDGHPRASRKSPF